MYTILYDMYALIWWPIRLGSNRVKSNQSKLQAKTALIWVIYTLVTMVSDIYLGDNGEWYEESTKDLCRNSVDLFPRTTLITCVKSC